MWEVIHLTHDPNKFQPSFLVDFSDVILTDDSGNLLLLAG